MMKFHQSLYRSLEEKTESTGDLLSMIHRAIKREHMLTIVERVSGPSWGVRPILVTHSPLSWRAHQSAAC